MSAKQTLFSPWQVASGLRLLGAVEGSGPTERTFLLRRADGQVVEVSELLNLVLTEVATGQPPDRVCQAVRDVSQRTLTTEGLFHLLEGRLEPLGLVERDGVDQTSPRARPLVSRSQPGVLMPPAGMQKLARRLAPLFWTPLVVAATAAVAVVDVLLLGRGELSAAVRDVLASPAMLLGLYVVLVLGAFVHETGHAAACSYGGARPGRMAYGVDLVFPVFSTDLTDSYRLDRTGRIRTHLGGHYFDVWCLLALGSAYLATGDGLFLLAVLVTQLRMLLQLVPVPRFDGYFVLADLTGAPDLFARVGPVLRSALTPGPPDPRVRALPPAARRVVVTWVLVVVPLLALATGWLLWHLPSTVRQALDSLTVLVHQVRSAAGRHDLGALAVSFIEAVLLVLPLLVLAVLLVRMAAVAVRLALRVLVSDLLDQEAVMSTDMPNGTLSAAAFTDDDILPRHPPVPDRGWRRAVYQTSGGRLNPGPGPDERRRAELEGRLRTPIEGSRRVVVMSRKGGVGKTTIALSLGSVFATIRGDRVVAVDANPDAGNLAHRVAPPNGRAVTDVLADMGKIDTYAELRSYLSQAPESRLEVLASDDDPRIGMALDRDDYHRLIDLLDHYYNLILLDTGTGILDSANQGLLTEADELVLVLRPGVDGGRAAALTLDWLDAHGYDELVRRAVVVINGVRRGVGAPLGQMTEHFEQRCSRVVTVPWDPALETGARTVQSALQRDTQDSLVALAAAVADNFPMSGARH